LGIEDRPRQLPIFSSFKGLFVSASLFDALFRPRGIAIVGASNDSAKLSGRPLDYLIRLGYSGAIVPVNPTRTQVQGVTSYKTVTDAKVAIDLAIVVVPSPRVTQALRDCASAGVRAAIVFASGFSEMGGRGLQLQQEIEEISRTTGLRVIGPNCLGTFSLPSKAFATFSSAFDEEGALPDDAIALVSQSGAVGTFIYATMVASGVGVRYFANTGNEADVSVGELLGVLAMAPDVDVLIGYLEDARRLDGLDESAHLADSMGKPLLLLKSGVTAEGARAVGFHTGSQPGDDADFQALVDRHGAIRVESMEAASDTAMLFRQGRRAGGPRVAIVTSSGGASAITTDAAIQLGLRIDPPSAAVQDAIRLMLPEYGSVANPVDLTGALLTDTTLIRRVLDQLVLDPNVDVILVVLGNADRGGEALVEGIAEVCARTRKPFVVSWSGGSGRPRQSLQARRIPTYAEPLRAVRSIKRLVDFSQRQRQRQRGA
jgi:acyl-CoA synthetase (NDP forming)